MASAWTRIAAGKIVTHASERLDHDANSRRAVEWARVESRPEW